MLVQNLPITASTLYDLVNCPHRVTMDAFGNPAARDPVNAFVELLWKRGTEFENEVIADLAGKVPFTNLQRYAGAEKERRTLEAMRAGAPLIYGGRLAMGDLLGDPDLLRREGEGYVPGDIKSGRGEEGGDEDNEGKPKLHYAVQLALYVDLLERQSFSAGRRGFIWDVHGNEVTYDLTDARGPKTPTSLWDEYQAALSEARAIYAQEETDAPGLCLFLQALPLVFELLKNAAEIGRPDTHSTARPICARIFDVHFCDDCGSGSRKSRGLCPR